MAHNKSLSRAKSTKNDEFYTRLTDIEKELRHYRRHFKDKIVFCNCDDPFESNFFRYFVMNFNRLKLKQLVCTCYAGSPVMGQQMTVADILGKPDTPSDTPYKAIVNKVYDITGDGAIDQDDIIELFRAGENTLEELMEDGDFRSQECLDLLSECDIVCTNPPFSLFRSYIALLMEYRKRFIIIGNQNVITYRDFFPLLQNNFVWLGNNNPPPKLFYIPESADRKNVVYDDDGNKMAVFGNICWFTNLDISRRHEDMILIRRYNPEDYPTYANYNAIEVQKLSDIPFDYDGYMGVPLTFLNKYNPDQFEIIGRSHDIDWAVNECPFFNPPDEAMAKSFKAYDNTWRVQIPYLLDEDGMPINIYQRIFIRNKHPEEPR